MSPYPLPGQEPLKLNPTPFEDTIKGIINDNNFDSYFTQKLELSTSNHKE